SSGSLVVTVGRPAHGESASLRNRDGSGVAEVAGGGGKSSCRRQGQSTGVGVEPGQSVGGYVENLCRLARQGETGGVSGDAAIGAGELESAADGVGASSQRAAAQVAER